MNLFVYCFVKALLTPHSINSPSKACNTRDKETLFELLSVELINA